MNSKTILSVLLMASLAGNASFLITAFSKRAPQRSAALEQLKLTADQASQFEGSKRAFQDERRQTQQRMAELRNVLADEFATQTPDRQRLVATTVEMAQVQADMRPKLVDHLLALHALLTPDQRADFARLLRTADGGAAMCPGAMLYPSSEGG